MNVIEKIIEKLKKKLENDVESSNDGHIELERLSEDERKQAFSTFSEGNPNLRSFLEVAYNNGAPSIFCCSGHGERAAYVTLKVTDENIELLRKVGKVLSNMNVTTSFIDNYIKGKYVSYHGFKTISTAWLDVGAKIMMNPELYDDSNPSIYYHEEFQISEKQFGFKIKEKLLYFLRSKTTPELSCGESEGEKFRKRYEINKGIQNDNGNNPVSDKDETNIKTNSEPEEIR